MNRQQRRRMGKGKRAGGVAGVSLVAFAGLFGGYLGNGRTQRAYAVSTPSCATTTLIPIASAADWNANVGAATNPGVECVIFDIQADFTVNQTFGFVWPDGPSPVKVVVDGNNHTITGAANANDKTFIGIGLRATDQLFVSDLTLSGMRNTGWPGAAINAYTRGVGATSVYLDNVTVENGSNEGLAFFRPQVYVRGRALITDSTFRNNSNSSTARPTKHDGPSAAIMLYGPTNGSVISNSTFVNNSITANLGVAPAPAGQSYGAALAILNNGSNPTNTVTIEDSVFASNSVLSSDGVNRGLAIGGAINSGAALVVRDSLFTNNSVTGGAGARGGAIQMGQGWFSGYQKPSLTVVDSQFTGNTATTLTGDAIGGAIGSGTASNFVTGDVSVSGSTFSGNSVSTGSGTALGGAVGIIANASSNRFTVVNSTFTDDTTSGTTAHRGGAIYAKTAPLSVDFSTITGNSSGEGGGIFSVADDTITNSIVNLNTGTSGADVKSGGTTRSDHSLFTATTPYSSVAGTFTPGPGTVFTSTPQVDALANNGGFTLPGGASLQTMALKAGVAARGAGTLTPTSGVLPANDQRGPGYPRVLQCTVSMGALAAVGPNPPCPAAPINLAATPGDGLARIAFTPAVAGTSPITNYEYSLDGGTTWSPANPLTTAAPVTITGLTNGQTYSVLLRATSSAGAGTASSSVSVTPAAAPAPNPPRPVPLYPPSAPRDVTAVPGDGSADVRWKEPADTGSFPVSDYLVTAGPGGQTCLAKAPALTCTVTGLTNGHGVHLRGQGAQWRGLGT